MGWNYRPPSALDPDADPLLLQADSSQGHDIPTGVSPTTAKLQDWIAWLRANVVIFDDPVGSPGVIAGPITIDGNLAVTGSASTGADLTVGDDLIVTDDALIGDDLTVSGDASVSGALTAASATVNGTITAGSGAHFTLSPARSWTRRNLRVCGTTSSGGTPLGGTHESETLLAVSYSGVYRPSVVLKMGSGAETWLELDDLPDGATISQVQLRTYGDGAPTIINQVATYRVVRWTDETTVDNMSATVNDGHTTGNWTTKSNQTIAINANGTIDRAYRYAVIVTHHDTDTNVAMHILTVVSTGTGTTLRL